MVLRPDPPPRHDAVRTLLWVPSRGDYQERGRYYEWLPPSRGEDSGQRGELVAVCGEFDTAEAALARVDLVRWGERWERVADPNARGYLALGYLIDVEPPPELQLRPEPAAEPRPARAVVRGWCSIPGPHLGHNWPRVDPATGEVQPMACPGVNVREAARTEW